MKTIIIARYNENLEWLNNISPLYNIKIYNKGGLITNNAESSSILELGDHAQIYPNIVNVESVRMKTTTLDSIYRKIGVNEGTFNILNLDIQGAELKALKGCLIGSVLTPFLQKSIIVKCIRGVY